MMAAAVYVCGSPFVFGASAQPPQHAGETQNEFALDGGFRVIVAVTVASKAW